MHYESVETRVEFTGHRDVIATRHRQYVQLMGTRRFSENRHTLACMIASWQIGNSVLPVFMGLEKSDFEAMLEHNFPGAFIQNHKTLPFPDYDRLPERDDIINLLMQYCKGEERNELWLAEIIAAGCLGYDHLWQDLGLWSRSGLNNLLLNNFPEFARKNNRDMKWKKFIYKQLCDMQGVYLCRAPSCDVCVAYESCFGSEE